jgi:hypothetical protein
MDQYTKQLLQKRLFLVLVLKGPTWGEGSSNLAQKSSNSPYVVTDLVKTSKQSLLDYGRKQYKEVQKR